MNYVSLCFEGLPPLSRLSHFWCKNPMELGILHTCHKTLLRAGVYHSQFLPLGVRGSFWVGISKDCMACSYRVHWYWLLLGCCPYLVWDLRNLGRQHVPTEYVEAAPPTCFMNGASKPDFCIWVYVIIYSFDVGMILLQHCIEVCGIQPPFLLLFNPLRSAAYGTHSRDRSMGIQELTGNWIELFSTGQAFKIMSMSYF